MVVGVENTNTEHKKVEGQRAKTKLGKAFEGLFRTKRHNTRVAKVVSKKNKNK